MKDWDKMTARERQAAIAYMRWLIPLIVSVISLLIAVTGIILK